MLVSLAIIMLNRKLVFAPLVLGFLVGCFTAVWITDRAPKLVFLADTTHGTVKTLRDLHPALRQSQEMKISHEHRFAQRRELLTKSCQKNNQYFQRSFPKIPPALKVTAKEDASICPIQKVGSMFWTRMLTVYKKELGHNAHTNLNTRQSVSPKQELPPLLILSTRKYIFVRNPYTRLLSGYVDKLYAVNPMYWKITGLQIVKSTRYNDMSGALQKTCGDDVTFEEFVSFILDSNDRNIPIDGHFAPIHRHCGLCDVQYDYIGKMETFFDDMVFFAGDMGMFEQSRTRTKLLNEGFRGVNQMLVKNAYMLFTDRRSAMESCGVTLLQGLRVTWKRWQIRGMISMEIPFPDEVNDERITYDKFVALAQEANARSSPEILSRGKAMALKEAYGSLSHNVKVKLKKYFEQSLICLTMMLPRTSCSMNIGSPKIRLVSLITNMTNSMYIFKYYYVIMQLIWNT